MRPSQPVAPKTHSNGEYGVACMRVWAGAGEVFIIPVSVVL